MSKYTTELRFLCEQVGGLTESRGYNDTATIIETARPKIFSFDYPIFDTDYKGTLETKFLKHYYTREICAETYGRWKMFLDDKFNLIMPYYNQLYESALKEFDPFKDVDVYIKKDNTNNRNTQEDENGKNNGEYSGKADSTVSQSSDTWSAYSDTPQGGLNGVADMTYLTNATHNYGTGTTITNSTNSGTSANTDSRNKTGVYKTVDDYIEHIAGKKGTQSYSSLLKEWRETFLNIDAMVLDECGDLFFGLW